MKRTLGMLLLLGLAASAKPLIFSDWTQSKPGVVHHITVQDLPAINQEQGKADTGPHTPADRKGAIPQAPPGFKVALFASGFRQPRAMKRAPNGDIFVAESGAGKITVLSGGQKKTFTEGFPSVFGIAFYPPGPNPKWVYAANDAEVVKIPYPQGGKGTKVVDLPKGGKLRGGGHWTRDLTFSPDGKRLFIAVGSYSNVSDDEAEHNRANILVCDPEGKGLKVYAGGLRNPVGMALHPKSGELWTTVNERDGLGDNLPPDYVTHVEEGGFYGWPWYFIGGNQDPRHAGKHPELKSKVIVPDVLVQPHTACLQPAFYTGTAFPQEYQGDLFVCQHGSWNRTKRTGYAVIRIPFHGKNRPTGEYEDFLTGFLHPDGSVWGRPVGVVVAADGSLLVSDDFSNSIWRVSR